MKRQNNDSGAVVSGVSASSLLGIAFIILKLCGVINWSWLWVLSPFWIPAVFVIVVFMGIAFLIGFSKN